MAKRRPSGDGMVRKREDGRWEGRLVVGHKDDGRPIFRSVFGKSQRELLEKLHQQKTLFQDVELTEDSRLTLAEWLDKWLENYVANTVRSTTLKGYRSYADNYIKPVLGNKTVSKITATDIQKMYTKLKKSGRIRWHPDHEHRLSDSMIRSIHTMLHGALKTAVQKCVIPINPTEGLPTPKANHKPKNILNQKELDIFLKTIETEPQWHDFFYTELTTGLRRGEICGLQWSDFDQESGTLEVKRTVILEDGKLTIGQPKTDNSIRKIILPASTVSVLAKRKKVAASDWIFPNFQNPDQPLRPSTAYNHLKTILKKSDLPTIRFHDLRHTFATHALANGVDAKTLSGILGHSKASFTLDTYTHVTGDMQKNAATIVGGFLENILGEELCL